MAAEYHELPSDMICNIKRTIYELLKWIDQNIHRPLSVDDIVMKSGYSKFYLQHAFKAVTGEPIARSIRRRKLAAAACILHESDAGISDISFAFGFDDVSTFYRSFRREFGLSPGEYRRRRINPSVRTSCPNDERRRVSLAYPLPKEAE